MGLFFSYLFEIETINLLIHSDPIVPLETTPDSRPKWAKAIVTCF